MFQIPSHAGRPRAWALVAAVLAVSGSVAWSQTSRTYTTSADFAEGTLTNVNSAAVADQLQLDVLPGAPSQPLVNIAVSGRGTLVRIDANTGAILGEYATAPTGLARNPSRTAVDSVGNVWVGNRDEGGNVPGVGPRGSVVKIGVCLGGTRTDAAGNPDPLGGYLKGPFTFNSCVDRDGDGLIRTSRGLGDVLAWPNVTDGVGGANGIVQDAVDEAILVFQRTNGLNVRHVSIDTNDDVWVGGFPLFPDDFDLLNGQTGAIVRTLANPLCGGHGGVTDANNVVWSTTGEAGTDLMRFDTVANIVSCIDLTLVGQNNTGANHGLAIGPDGSVWVTQFDLNQILKFTPAGTLVPGFPKPTFGDNLDRSVGISPIDGHAWVDGSQGQTVSRLDANGNLVKVVDLGADGRSPRGVSVDENGMVWIACTLSDTVKRVNPAGGLDGLGAVDLTIPLGRSARPYNFGEMAGSTPQIPLQPSGSWQVVYDSAVMGNEYGQISWNAAVPAGTSLTVEFRTADSAASLPFVSYAPATNGVPFNGVFGRFVDVLVTFTRPPTSVATPVLFDLTIEGLGSGGPEDECPTGQRHPASLLVFPEFDNRSGGLTMLSVTNTNQDFTPVGSALFAGSVAVEFVYIGRYGPNGQVLPCLEYNRTHVLTPNDTLSVLTQHHNPNHEQGYVYVFAKSPQTGAAIVHNFLIGHALVLNTIESVDYSFNPYTYLGIGPEGSPTDHDADGVRDLNNVEYGCSPDRLLVPRFLGQGADLPQGEALSSAHFASDLVLLNLTGGADFRAIVDFLIYNDNEEVFSGQTQFQCWVKRPLLEISGAFGAAFLAGSNQDPNEILGASWTESGWFKMNGNVAFSSALALPDPAILALLVERMPGEHGASALPFELGAQTNGDLLVRGPFGDTTP